MSTHRFATSAVLMALVAAPIATIGAGTAVAASSTAYCYRNANNDNGTRIQLRNIFVREGTFAAYAQQENWNGSQYVPAGPGRNVPDFAASYTTDISRICATISNRAGFSGYNIGVFA